MKSIKSILVASIGLMLGITACNSGYMRRTPGYIYAPDMTYSRAYDAYTSNPNFSDSQTSRPPVPGAIAVGHALPDHLMENDSMAYKTYTTSLRFNDDQMAEGKRLFNIYCGICHGTNLDGQGPLYTSGKFAAMPANFKDGKYLHMPVGQMYAAILYGKNMMGAYASQLEYAQRWMVIAYIKKMQSENGGDPFTFLASATPAMASADSMKHEDMPKAAVPVASATTAAPKPDMAKEKPAKPTHSKHKAH